MFRVTWTDPNGGDWELGWTIDGPDIGVGFLGPGVDELVECSGPNGEKELPAEYDQAASEYSNERLKDYDPYD